MFKKIIVGMLFCLPSLAQNEMLVNSEPLFLLSKQVEMVGYQPYNKLLDKKQLKCLTDNVYFEAGNEIEEAKVAVALVTLNRLKHEHFPDTICDVVYQRTKWKCQFTWVCTKSRKINYWSTYNESKKIAEYVITNYEVIDDNTKGATFFHHKRLHNPFSRIRVEKTAAIGKHIFYKL